MNLGVIDLGFGDAGKGLVTRALALKHRNSVVVRYSGGPQAAHNVWFDEKNHIFSNFGAGTVDGVPTYWHRTALFYPRTFIREAESLAAEFPDKTFGDFLIHPDTPVITPFDVKYNKFTSLRAKDTVGLGIGATWQREEDHYQLHVRDLFYPNILKIKLNAIRQHYHFDKKMLARFNDDRIESFLIDVEDTLPYLNVQEEWVLNTYDNIIFEGSQGLLLDPEIGFFPYVTRSSVGSTNIRWLVESFDPILVTRAYQVRHGDGPMTNLEIPFEVNNPEETNKENINQGAFRISVLDLDLLDYSVNSDPYLRKNIGRSLLIVTCVDHMKEFKFSWKGGIETFENKYEFLHAISHRLGANKIVSSESKFSEHLDI